MTAQPSRVRLGYLVSHPIQYQAPLLRRVAKEPDLDLEVLFGSDFSVRGYRDQGFGVDVAWDVPLLEGYRSRVLPAWRDNGTVSATTPLSRGMFRALRDAKGNPRFDALWVHGYASANALQGMLAASVLGIPVLLRAESWLGDRQRGALKSAARAAFFKFLRPLVSAVLPIGSHNRAYWHACLGADLPQFSVPYAVDNAFFAGAVAAAGERAEVLRQDLGLDADRPVVLFASKLQERKHADHLLEAAALLRQRFEIRPQLLIVGDGEERQRLQTQAAALGLGADVLFAGFRNQTELPAFFALADVFVLPSRHEPWGLIVNEAMAGGLPVVVSSDVGAAPDLVADGVNGFVFPVGEVAALAEALHRVLEDPARTHRMGEASRARIATWDFEADVRGLRQALAYATRRLRP